MDAGAGDDAHIQLLGFLGQDTDVPHGGNVGHRSQAIDAPGLDILFRTMAAQNDQHLLMPQKAAVHGIEDIGDQVVIEGVVEQDAPSVQQLAAGEQVIAVQLHPRFALVAHEAAIGFLMGLVAVFQLRQQLVSGGDGLPRGTDGGIFRIEFIREQLAQNTAHDGIIADTLRVIRFAHHGIVKLFFGQAVQEEEQFAYQNHAESRIDRLQQLLRQVQFAGDKCRRYTQHHNTDVEGFQESTALPIVGCKVPFAQFLVKFVENAHDQLEQATLFAAQELENRQCDQLADQVDQHQHGVCHIKGPVFQVQRLEPGCKCRHPAHNCFFHLGEVVREPAGKIRQPDWNLFQEPVGQIIDIIDPVNRDKAEHQRQKRHCKLLIAHLPAQIPLVVEKCKDQEWDQHHEHSRQAVQHRAANLFNHTGPPF